MDREYCAFLQLLVPKLCQNVSMPFTKSIIHIRNDCKERARRISAVKKTDRVENPPEVARARN